MISSEYEDDLAEMAREYKMRLDAGECFVHIRKRQSSNKDLRALSHLTKGGKFFKVNLRGTDAESILTNSAQLASVIQASGCESCEDVEKELEKVVRGHDWEEDKKGFEQHMVEEDRVRLRWQSGGYEEKMACETCGDKNAWDKMHHCCEKQCAGILNALQAFPLAAWDDISAAPLDPLKVIEARKVEIGYAQNKPVWKKIPRWQAKEKGWKIIKSRWIDINKGDDDQPNYRSRMVGKEFNDREVDGLFAATPPLEALRLILSWAATRGSGLSSGAGANREANSILIADVSRAFFEAPAKRDICVELPEEALEKGETTQDTVGKLMASLYGTRDASANWQEEVARCMVEWGFTVGRFNPCMYHHEKRGIVCLVHGDDFVSVGKSLDLKWMKEKLKARFEIKTTTVGMNAENGEVKEARILNRIIRVTDKGWEYEADQRHADLIVQETGAEKQSSLTHPGGEKRMLEEEEATEELVGAEATRFRAVAARANYLAADRPDIQYSVKEICRRMARPVAGDWQKLVRLGRYLKGSPRCVLEYQWQESCGAPAGYSDSDWAGDRKTGKSTSGGIIMMGCHLIKSWSRTQDSVTLSSAEAELVALGKLAMEILGIRSMCSEWHMMDQQSASPLYADASAALSIAKRQGAGKMRHINVKSLWLQEKEIQKELRYEKVKGEDNPSDGLTKHVRQELAERYSGSVNYKLRVGRAKTSLQLAGGG